MIFLAPSLCCSFTVSPYLIKILLASTDLKSAVTLGYIQTGNCIFDFGL